jgi:hypothetical protein
MAVYARALLPRMLVVTAVWIIASGTITFAADKTLVPRARVKTSTAAVPAKPILIVPDVRSQAFVFAKGILEDGGFAWRVTGGVHGYATNRVVSQSPAPGTRVIDTGAPTIRLTLARGQYGQDGTPENAAPYAGTSIVLADAAAKASATKPAAKKPAAKPSTANRGSAAKAGKVARKAAKPAAKRTARPQKHTARRPPAFVVPGAPKEPLDEMSLPARAKLLSAWMTPSRRPTAANQRHWLYQHAWIVTGAKFGWWHGAAALEVLISVDRRVESQWGIGSRSETVARAALAAVKARAR